MRHTLAIALACCGCAAALPASAQPSGESPPLVLEPEAARVPDERQRRGVVPHPHQAAEPLEREPFRDPDLRYVASHSGMIFDGVLVSAITTTPPGMRILVTEYTFEIHEWLSGGVGQRFLTLREAGGLEEDGGGMTSCRSHQLQLSGRYLIFARHDAFDVILPFNRVLQIMDHGAVVADEHGRIVTGFNGGVLELRREPEVRSLEYFGGGVHVAQERPLMPPPVAIQGEVFITKPTAPLMRPPMHAAALTAHFRDPAAPVPDPMGPQPAGLPSNHPTDFKSCGKYRDTRMNFYYLMPDDGNFTWTQTAMIDWNHLVAPGGSHEWIFGNWVDANGQPFRNWLPGPNNGENNCGVPTSTQLANAGYSTWAGWGNPAGFCLHWVASSCGRIKEADAFVNPTLQNNQNRFRRTVVHELGHAIGFGHEDRYVAIMVSGTWRVPPNYASNLYTRGDEVNGGTTMLGWANAATPGSWNINEWRDMSTISQSHPNWGNPGDVGQNMTRLSTYTANGGQNITLQRMFVENRGKLGFSQPVTLRVYLSSNNVITSNDIQVAQIVWPFAAPLGVANNFDIGFTVPNNIPSGDYFIGWIITTTEQELSTPNNTAILVGGASAFTERTLYVNNGPLPGNNTCGSAYVVTAGNSYAGTTQGATNNGSSSCGNSSTTPDVWFRYTADCTGTLIVDTCGSSYNTVLSVHSACGGVELACNINAPPGFCPSSLDSRVTVNVTAGTTYRIRVSGSSGSVGQFNLNVNTAPPSNDNCSSPIIVSNGITPFATCGATTDGPNEPDICNFHNYTQIDNDVWFRYTSTCSGTVTISLCESDFDTKLAVYPGLCPSNPGQAIACNDDLCDLQSQVSFQTPGSERYLIRIGGYGGATGRGRMQISCSPLNITPLPNPAFSSTHTSRLNTLGFWFVAPVDFTILGLRVPDETNHGLQNVEVVRLAAAPPALPTVSNDFTSLTASSSSGFVGVASHAIIPTQLHIKAGDIIGVLGACGDQVNVHSSLAGVNFFQTQIFGSPTTLRRFGMQENLAATPAQDVFTENNRLGRIEVYYGPPMNPCYPNCDNSTIEPILNVEDFTCFINAFAAASMLPHEQQLAHYANCDGSTVPPVLNVEDFTCFINRFAAGCP
jgi:hypothetical protein